MKYFMLVIFLLVSSNSYCLEGIVVKVKDGDTVDIVDSNKNLHVIRFAQIDAPEKNQSWGMNSKIYLTSLIFKKKVKVVDLGDDGRGRRIGKVFLNDEDICAKMVLTGNAWVYRKYMKDREYLRYESVARKEKLGLWSTKDPVPPWEWRKSRRGAKSSLRLKHAL